VRVELLVDERGHVALDVRRHPSIADLEEHERSHHLGKIAEMGSSVGHPELGAAMRAILEGRVRGGHDTRDPQKTKKRVEVGFAILHRPGAFALPARHTGQRRLVSGLDLEIEVFREALDEPEPLREGRPALEPDLPPQAVEPPEDVGDPVVLLDQRWRQAATPGASCG
jgi:hypothetical protein